MGRQNATYVAESIVLIAERTNLGANFDSRPRGAVFETESR